MDRLTPRGRSLLRAAAVSLALAAPATASAELGAVPTPTAPVVDPVATVTSILPTVPAAPTVAEPVATAPVVQAVRRAAPAVRARATVGTVRLRSGTTVRTRRSPELRASTGATTRARVEVDRRRAHRPAKGLAEHASRSLMSAAETIVLPLTGPLTQPCTGEAVAVNGFIHMTLNVDGGGGMYAYVQTHSMTGYGLVTGDKYVANQTDQTHFLENGATKFHHYLRFVKQGETGVVAGLGDDFYVKLLITTTGEVPPIPEGECR